MESVQSTTRGNQPQLHQPPQQQVQDLLLQPVGQDPVAEPGQHGEVESRIRQLDAEQVLPVDPCAGSVRGLAVGQVLGELQDADQRQLSWRDTRTAPNTEGGPEHLILEQWAELVPNPHRQATLGEGSEGHLPCHLRDLCP